MNLVIFQIFSTIVQWRIGSFSVNQNKNEKFLELKLHLCPPTDACFHAMQRHFCRPPRTNGRPHQRRTSFRPLFRTGNTGNWKKVAANGASDRRGAHVMAMRPFSASAAGPRLPAIHQPLAVTALHAHHEHFQRAHSPARRKLKFN
jgi:hypothetical protein